MITPERREVLAQVLADLRRGDSVHLRVVLGQGMRGDVREMFDESRVLWTTPLDMVRLGTAVLDAYSFLVVDDLAAASPDTPHYIKAAKKRRPVLGLAAVESPAWLLRCFEVQRTLPLVTAAEWVAGLKRA